MNKIRVMSWDRVNDSMILSWSTIEIIHNAHHALQQSATNVFARGLGITRQAEIEFADQKQKERLLALQQRFEQIYDTTLWMTIWLFAQRNKTPVLRRDIPNKDQIAAWSEDELILRVYHVLQSHVWPAFQCYQELLKDYCYFFNEQQKKELYALQRHIKRIVDVQKGIKLWVLAKTEQTTTFSENGHQPHQPRQRVSRRIMTHQSQVLNY